MARGFTLIELILVLGLFAFLSALLMGNLFSIFHFKDAIQIKKDLNFEISSALGNGAGGPIRSGFAINYKGTDATKSQQPSEGFKDEVDKLSIFTNRAETQYFTLYREPLKTSGDDIDTARLMIAYSTGEVYPLNTTETVIEDFDVTVPPDPRTGGDQEIQPYATLYIRARHRHPLEGTADEKDLNPFQNVRASARTTYALRNTHPSNNL